MFLAGFEVDLPVIRGTPIALAARSWLLSVALAALVGAVAAGLGHGSAALYLALPLCTTALGTLLPIVSDSGIMRTAMGRHLLAVGSVGEFGPIVLIALLLGGHHPIGVIAVLLAFGGLIAVTLWLARHPSTRWLRRTAYRSLHSPAQLPVRMAMLLIVLLVFLAGELGLDVLLGSFAAGLVVRVAIADMGDPTDQVVLIGKYEAVGFGLLIPVFFILSGVQIDVQSLVRNPSALALVPLVLVLLAVCRAGPVLLLYRTTLPRQERTALGFLASTSLLLVVVITALGVAAGALSGEVAAALVAAGLLSVLIFPAAAQRITRDVAARHTPTS